MRISHTYSRSLPSSHWDTDYVSLRMVAVIKPASKYGIDATGKCTVERVDDAWTRSPEQLYICVALL